MPAQPLTPPSPCSTDNGFTFSIRFDAVPRLSWKTPYRELEVSVEAGDAADDAAEVERRLLSLRKGQAKLKVVADRGLQVTHAGALATCV
jgi:FKBP-type peptidyl-prolyl cis-trans isomerase (trigger factor)